MRDSMRRWRRLRSPHARVLEGLEEVIASHPSSGRRHARRPDDDRVVPLPGARGRPEHDTVVPLHPPGPGPGAPDGPDRPDDGPSAA